MIRSNTKRVLVDAVEITVRLKKTETTISGLMREYGCGYQTIMRVVLSQMTKAQWGRAKKKILAKGGVKTRFQKGHIPWLKGKKGIHMSPKTEFRKGHLPANHLHVGTIRTVKRERKGNVNVFQEIKVSGIKQGRHKWISYARYVYEKEFGPIPEGYLVIHDDGDTLNDSPDNLKAVNRREHLARQKNRNPGWKKKAIRSYKKTVRLKRKTKAKIKKKMIKQEKQDKQHKSIFDGSEAEIIQIRGSVVLWWECTGCGFEATKEPPPLPCPKCGNLNYEKIRQRRVGT